MSGGWEVVQKRCRQLVQMHGGQRKAAKVVGIDEGYFHHLLHGTKTHASDEVLDKLFIRRDVVFTALPVLFGLDPEQAVAASQKVLTSPDRGA